MRSALQVGQPGSVADLHARSAWPIPPYHDALGLHVREFCKALMQLRQWCMCICRPARAGTQLHAAPWPRRRAQVPARRQLPDAVRSNSCSSPVECHKRLIHTVWVVLVAHLLVDAKHEAGHIPLLTAAAALRCAGRPRQHAGLWHVAQAEPQRHVAPEHQRRAGRGGAAARAARGQPRLPQQ
jgi:hypothetical protein